MQITTGERGDLHATRKRLAPVCTAADGRHRTTGRPDEPVTTAQRRPGDAKEQQ
jgi:hypothetical protein